MQNRSQNLDWNPQLDGLRGIAVLAVMLSHWIPEEWQLGLPLGTAGVQLFFVLSGFLITNILLRCREYDNKPRALLAFFARRALRIFPLYFLVLACGTYIGLIPWSDTFPWHALYLSNILFFVRNEWGGSASHFWSLAVEEQFYLLWPFIILYSPTLFVKHLPLFLFLVGLLIRSTLPIAMPDHNLWDILLPSNIPALALGALIAVNPKTLSKITNSHIALLLTVFLTIRLLIPRNLITSELEYPLMLLVFAMAITLANSNRKNLQEKLLANPCLVYLGTISYGLYMLHNFAWFPLQRIAFMTGLEKLNEETIAPLAMFLLTFFGATLSWIFLEKPLLRLKRLFPYNAERQTR